MSQFISYLILGICNGSAYGLIACGIALIYRASGVFNLAHGALTALLVFFTYTFATMLGLPMWAAILLTFAVAAALGATIERGLIRPMIGQPLFSVMMMTIALMGIISAIITLFWGGIPLAYPTFLPTGAITVFGMLISKAHLAGLGLSLATFAMVLGYIKFSNVGLDMRATSEDNIVAQSVGINVNNVLRLTWVVGLLVAAVGSFVFGTFCQASHYVADTALKAIVVVILGGLQSVPGALIGGIILGVLEAMSGAYLEPIVGGGFTQVAPYFVLLIILLVMPYGLFGEKRIERI